MLDASDAIDIIRKVVDPYDDIPYGFNRKIVEVTSKIDRSSKFKRITEPKLGKIDYINKTKKDAEIGLLGEKLVIQYEQERLYNIGLEQYVERIKWVSKESDAYGFDILSYDKDEKLGVKEIKIEVKTTASKVDTDFYVSKNELEKSIEFGGCYCVYRVYDSRSETPKFYRAFGPIEKDFYLDPVTYMARYKYPIAEY